MTAVVNHLLDSNNDPHGDASSTILLIWHNMSLPLINDRVCHWSPASWWCTEPQKNPSIVLSPSDRPPSVQIKGVAPPFLWLCFNGPRDLLSFAWRQSGNAERIRCYYYALILSLKWSSEEYPFFCQPEAGRPDTLLLYASCYWHKQLLLVCLRLHKSFYVLHSCITATTEALNVPYSLYCSTAAVLRAISFSLNCQRNVLNIGKKVESYAFGVEHSNMKQDNLV